MKGEKWVSIKCDSVPKFQVIKEGLHGTTLKKDPEAFKGENERERGPNMIATSVVWLSTVLERPISSLVIWLSKKDTARDFLL